MASLTYNQVKICSLTAKLTGGLSFLASGAIVYDIFGGRHNDKTKRTTLSQILIGMSIMDMGSSFVYVWGSWAIPTDFKPVPIFQARGNHATCTAQCFLLALFGIGIPMYSLSLAVFTYLAVYRNWNEERDFKRYRWYFHLLPVLHPTLTSVIIVAKDEISPSILYCWIDDELLKFLGYVVVWIIFSLVIVIFTFLFYELRQRELAIRNRQFRQMRLFNNSMRQRRRSGEAVMNDESSSNFLVTQNETRVTVNTTTTRTTPTGIAQTTESTQRQSSTTRSQPLNSSTRGHENTVSWEDNSSSLRIMEHQQPVTVDVGEIVVDIVEELQDEENTEFNRTLVSTAVAAASRSRRPPAATIPRVVVNTTAQEQETCSSQPQQHDQDHDALEEKQGEDDLLDPSHNTSAVGFEEIYHRYPRGEEEEEEDYEHGEVHEDENNNLPRPPTITQWQQSVQQSSVAISRYIFVQGLQFSMIIVLTFFFPTLLRTQQLVKGNDAHVSFPVLFGLALLLPLQGVWNALVYFKVPIRRFLSSQRQRRRRQVRVWRLRLPAVLSPSSNSFLGLRSNLRSRTTTSGNHTFTLGGGSGLGGRLTVASSSKKLSRAEMLVLRTTITSGHRQEEDEDSEVGSAKHSEDAFESKVPPILAEHEDDQGSSVHDGNDAAVASINVDDSRRSQTKITTHGENDDDEDVNKITVDDDRNNVRHISLDNPRDSQDEATGAQYKYAAAGSTIESESRESDDNKTAISTSENDEGNNRAALAPSKGRGEDIVASDDTMATFASADTKVIEKDNDGTGVKFAVAETIVDDNDTGSDSRRTDDKHDNTITPLEGTTSRMDKEDCICLPNDAGTDARPTVGMVEQNDALVRSRSDDGDNNNVENPNDTERISPLRETND
ncbi:hypothetical protein ACA910_010009 [Epithemia clementina (nom. ined.)]